MRFAIWSFDLAICEFCFLQTLFLMHKVEQAIKKSILLFYFHDLGKRNFFISVNCDPQFFDPVNGAGDARCTIIFLGACSDCNAGFTMARPGKNTALYPPSHDASLYCLQYALNEQLSSTNFFAALIDSHRTAIKTLQLVPPKNILFFQQNNSFHHNSIHCKHRHRC